MPKEAGVNPDKEPLERSKQPPTSELRIVHQSDVVHSLYCCSLKRGDTLEQPLFLPDTDAVVNWKQAFIVVFSIVGIPKDLFLYKLKVSLLVLANAFGRPVGGLQKTLPKPPVRQSHRLEAIGPIPVPCQKITRQVLCFLAAGNFFVGFHLPWLLTVLKFLLAAPRVVVLRG